MSRKENFHQSIMNKVSLQIMADDANHLAEAIHYPKCWDTIAYPRLSDAIIEIIGCAGCNECKVGKK